MRSKLALSIFTILVLSTSMTYSNPRNEDSALNDVDKPLTTTGCLTLEDIHNVNNSIDIQTPPSHKWTPQSLCDETSTFYKFFKAVLIIKNGKFSSIAKTSDGRINGFFKLKTPFELTRGKSFILKNCPDRNNRPLAFVELYRNSSITVCIENGTTADPIKYSSTIIHEAQHLEKNDIGHIDCIRNPKRGPMNCNSNTNELNSYSLELEFLNLIASKGLNFSESTRSSARYFSMLLKDQAFNEKNQSDYTTSIILRTSDNKLMILTKERSFKIYDTGQTISGRIFDRNYNGTLIKYDSVSEAISYLSIYDSGAGYPAPDLDEYNSIRIREKRPLIDALFTKKGACIIDGNNLIRKKISANSQAIALNPNSNYICLNPILCNEEPNGLNVLENFAKIIKIDFTEKKSSYQDVPSTNAGICGPGFKYIGKINGVLVGLKRTGELVYRDEEENWTRISNLSFNFMSNEAEVDFFYFASPPKDIL